MAMELVEDTITAKTTKRGSETIELARGEWLHIRYGNPSAPVDILLEQPPAGKRWKITTNVYIEETDA